MTIPQSLEELRVRERKLEAQRHNLEMSLSSSQRSVNDLTVQLTGCEGRLVETQALVAGLEENKRDLERKLASVSGILKEARSSSRPSTPTRRPASSSRSRGSSSPWRQQSFSQVDGGGGSDIDSLRGSVRDLLGRVSNLEAERDDLEEQLREARRKNADLEVQKLSADQQLQKQREKMAGSEEQLRKLEQKISLSDITLANQDEDLLRRGREMKDISTRLDSTSRQLDELRRQGSSSEEETRSLRAKEKKWEEERRRLAEAAREAEAVAVRLEVQKKGMAAEQARLQAAVGEKDAELKVS